MKFSIYLNRRVFVMHTQSLNTYDCYFSEKIRLEKSSLIFSENITINFFNVV